MTESKPFRTLEEGLLLLEQEAMIQPVSIEEILRILSGRGRLLLVMLLCLPFCQPLQIPGTSTPFGLLIAFIGIRMIFGKKVWLPKKLLKKRISARTLKKIVDRVLLIVRKMKRVVRPRWSWLCHSSYMRIINGSLIVILAILLALPLPVTLTNLAPAWSIFILAFAILEDDGLFVLIGQLLALASLAFFVLLAFSIEKAVVTAT